MMARAFALSLALAFLPPLAQAQSKIPRQHAVVSNTVEAPQDR